MEIIQTLPKTNQLGTSRYRPTPRSGTGRVSLIEINNNRKTY